MRLNVYMVLGVLDGYYTAMILQDLTKGDLLILLTVTALTNAVTGLLSSYVMNTSYLRNIEKRLLVRRGYLMGSALHKSLVLNSILDTLYWVTASLAGSLTSLAIKYACIMLTGPFSVLLYLPPPLLFMYALSRIVDSRYAPLAVLTVVLTLMVYYVSVGIT
ncbi:MAG: hypothetical protein ACP5L1_08260 [Caldivirga sp.]|uniref:hypothetical protein n=1 Tax=Caldivirga sp. TaxID=2080243 RepID=UPI003D10FA1E